MSSLRLLTFLFTYRHKIFLLQITLHITYNVYRRTLSVPKEYAEKKTKYLQGWLKSKRF
jgi:hypothetical protein